MNEATKLIVNLPQSTRVGCQQRTCFTFYFHVNEIWYFGRNDRHRRNV